MNQFSLVQAVDRFSQRIIVAVAPAADRWLDARFGQPFAVANADVLRTPDALLSVKRQFACCRSRDFGAV
jgi:hypothetical protein